MDAGIIAWIKRNYKYKVLDLLLDVVEEWDTQQQAGKTITTGTQGLTKDTCQKYGTF